MKIAIITAGGAGMFCGSCMQDNTLVRTLRLAGEDAVLVPTYTPIRVDEENVSVDRVFLGGVNVYLDSVMPGWKRLPGWMTSWLNRPSLIRFLTKFGNSTDAAKLGSLTLDMLRGTAGPQRREIRQFVQYLCEELKPDVIIFSNALLSGVLGELRPKFDGKILCLLQGDDVFLEGLTPRWKPRVMDQLAQNCRAFDGFLTHSRYYRDFMTRYLSLPDERFRQIPLSLDAEDSQDPQLPGCGTDAAVFRIGYFARICPEKGVQNLLEAASQVLPRYPHARIQIAGYLPEQYRSWFTQLLDNAQKMAPEKIEYLGSPDDRATKMEIIGRFDVLCVPTDYQEPKGLYVLEAGLVGVASLVPNHGAFPELIETLGCGMLYNPNDSGGLTAALQQCVSVGVDAASDVSGRVKSTFGMQATAASVQTAIHSFYDQTQQ